MPQNEDFFSLDDLLSSSSSNELNNAREEPKRSNDSVSAFKAEDADELRSAYLISNLVLNLLLSKGIIYQHEVDSLLQELVVLYQRKRGM